MTLNEKFRNVTGVSLDVENMIAECPVDKREKLYNDLDWHIGLLYSTCCAEGKLLSDGSDRAETLKEIYNLLFSEPTTTFDNIYFVSDLNNWGFEPMDKDPLDPFMFKLGYAFNSSGEFKFGTTPGSWENMYKATKENAPYTSTGVSFIKGFEPDYKWHIKNSERGMYRLSLDIRPGAERMLMRRFDGFDGIWLVGDATPSGWFLDNATKMAFITHSTKYPPFGYYEWRGHLNTGELKFSTDLQRDFMGGWYLAPSKGAEPTGVAETAIYINKSDDWYKNMYPELSIADIDYKWNIKEAGEYYIRVDYLYDKITIRKQEENVVDVSTISKQEENVVEVDSNSDL